MSRSPLDLLWIEFSREHIWKLLHYAPQMNLPSISVAIINIWWTIVENSNGNDKKFTRIYFTVGCGIWRIISDLLRACEMIFNYFRAFRNFIGTFNWFSSHWNIFHLSQSRITISGFFFTFHHLLLPLRLYRRTISRVCLMLHQFHFHWKTIYLNRNLSFAYKNHSQRIEVDY